MLKVQLEIDYWENGWMPAGVRVLAFGLTVAFCLAGILLLYELAYEWWMGMRRLKMDRVELEDSQIVLISACHLSSIHAKSTCVLGSIHYFLCRIFIQCSYKY